MVPRRASIQDVLKVKVEVKRHVIGTLVILRKSLLLAGGWVDHPAIRLRIATKLAHDGL